MKTLVRICYVALFFAVASMPLKGKAQLSLDSYFNVDWQFNIPLGNKFAKDASGWGMNFEGGYYVTTNIAVGGFLNFHTNNEYFPRRTINLSPTLSMNSDQQHQMFTLPFGALVKYRFIEADFQPYVAMKAGAAYAQMTSNYYIFESDKNTWGFFASPEVGANFYPWEGSMGFHAALYYSISTNQGSLMTYELNSINSLGFRLGVAF